MKIVEVSDGDDRWLVSIRDEDSEEDALEIGIKVGPADPRTFDWGRLADDLYEYLISNRLLVYNNSAELEPVVGMVKRFVLTNLRQASLKPKGE